MSLRCVQWAEYWKAEKTCRGFFCRCHKDNAACKSAEGKVWRIIVEQTSCMPEARKPTSWQADHNANATLLDALGEINSRNTNSWSPLPWARFSFGSRSLANQAVVAGTRRYVKHKGLFLNALTNRSRDPSHTGCWTPQKTQENALQHPQKGAWTSCIEIVYLFCCQSRTLAFQFGLFLQHLCPVQNLKKFLTAKSQWAFVCLFQRSSAKQPPQRTLQVRVRAWAEPTEPEARVKQRRLLVTWTRTNTHCLKSFAETRPFRDQ